MRDVGEVLAKCYGLKAELAAPPEELSLTSLTDFSQWVLSDKLRALNLAGWRERKPPFAKAIEEYRLAYEAEKG